MTYRNVIIISCMLLMLGCVERDKTYLETNYLTCLSGITTADNSLVDEFGLQNIYLAWEDTVPENFSNEKLLIITWEPYLKSSDDPILDEISNGQYDTMIRNFARSIDGKAFLRWGHEMNGDWYPWAGEPEKYKTAYIRIHDIFMEEERSDVKFIFSINNEDVPRTNSFEMYYPGDDYVDVIGIDAYDWKGRKSPNKILHKSYERIIENYPDKPIFITEISSAGDKKEFFKELILSIQNEYGQIKAFVWFDIDKEEDWKFTNDRQSMEILKNQAICNNNISQMDWIFKE